MKKPSRAPEPRSNASFGRRLAGYSTTAAVALLAAPVAHAQLQLLHLSDFNGGVAPDLTPPNNNPNNRNFVLGPFHANLYGRQNNYSFGLVSMAGHIAVAGVNNSSQHHPAAQNLALGAPIAGLAFGGNSNHLVAKEFRNGPHYGAFDPPKGGAATGYVGFKTQQNGHTYYGWVHVKVFANSTGSQGYVNRISLVGSLADASVFGAYILATDPGVAGFTAGQIAAIPEPASVATGLALFALGAAGVREHRRRKMAA